MKSQSALNAIAAIMLIIGVYIITRLMDGSPVDTELVLFYRGFTAALAVLLLYRTINGLLNKGS